MKYYIGVDIGGTNIKAGVVDENAQLVSKISLKTNAADGYKSVLAVIIDAVEQAVISTGRTFRLQRILQNISASVSSLKMTLMLRHTASILQVRQRVRKTL